MNEQEAIKFLESSSPHQRLRGARFFSNTANPDIIPQLRGFLHEERVAHVKTAIELAIKRNSKNKISPEPNTWYVKDDVDEDISQAAITKHEADKWTGILLHELEPKVGLIRVSAQKEIPNFDESKTKLYLDSLDMILDGFSNLRRAVATPKAEDFDLADLINTIISQEINSDVAITTEGKEPFVIKGDKNLLHMAISNGIRNATEAVQGNIKDKKVVVSWGQSDVEFSIAILDNGPGIGDDHLSLFKIGNSSKKNHGGFGLAIIKQALENLDGNAVLLNSRYEGARLELKWSKL